jgi:photosystem II stability/assembly factor-like uncharacterized protein
MATTKKKRRAPTPRVQHPEKRAAPQQRFPRWALWVAAAGPWLLALAVAAIVWLPGEDSEPAANSPSPTTANLPDTPDYHSLLVAPRDPRHVWLGSHVGLHESTDGGRSWAEAGLGGQDAMNLARTRDSATVWAAGHLVLAKSLDGGVTWTDVQPEGLPSLDVHGFATDPRNPRRLWAAIAGQGLFRSTDGGESFSPVSREVGPGVMALAVAPDGRVLAGDMQQGLLVSGNEGRTWRSVLGEGLMGLAINPRNPRRVVATSESGIFLSTDGGTRWRLVYPVAGGAGPVAWAPSKPKLGYVVGFDRVLYTTNDAGSSWQPVLEGS